MQLLQSAPLQSAPYLCKSRAQNLHLPDPLWCYTRRELASQTCAAGPNFSASSSAWRDQEVGEQSLSRPTQRVSVISQVTGRSRSSGDASDPSCSPSSSVALDTAKASLASVISRLNSAVVASQDDLRQLFQVVEELSALNPENIVDAAQAPLIDGRWERGNSQHAWVPRRRGFLLSSHFSTQIHGSCARAWRSTPQLTLHSRGTPYTAAKEQT
jgi:hypothetical protein